MEPGAVATPAKGKRLTKAHLIALLAEHRVKKYPDLYKGHEHDAVIFWEKRKYTRDDLLTAAVAYGIVRWRDVVSGVAGIPGVHPVAPRPAACRCGRLALVPGGDCKACDEVSSAAVRAAEEAREGGTS